MTKQEIVQFLNTIPFEVYVVGGAVRDLIIGLPVHDIDLTTPLKPKEVQELATAAGFKVLSDEPNYGMVRLAINGVNVEVTTFRSDINPDGRHAQIKYTSSIVDDLLRRDLTINAMAFGKDGILIDPYGGQEDIVKKKIRFVGKADDRVSEDLLRVLRAFRFAGRYGFTLDADAMLAITGIRILFKQSLAEKNNGISWERVTAEFEKAFQDEKPSEFIRLVEHYGYLDFLFPEFIGARGLKQNPYWHPEGDVFEHTMNVVDAADPSVRWEAFFHDFGKVHSAQPSTKGDWYSFIEHENIGAKLVGPICRRLRLPRKREAQIKKAVKMHMRIQNLVKPKGIRRFKVDVGNDIEILEKLGRADATNSPVGFNEKPFIFNEATVISDKIVNGNHFLKVGIPQGKIMGEYVREAYRLQIEENILDAEALVELTLENLK